MNRKKLFKLWSGLSDFDIISETADKGEDFSLCKEFLANRHGLQIKDYERLFEIEVNKYIKMLLRERQMHKVENIIHRIQGDLECILFEFAFECEGDEVKNFIFDYMLQRSPATFTNNKILYEFYQKVMVELKSSPSLCRKWHKKLDVIALSSIKSLEFADKQNLYMDLYFENSKEFILAYIEKQYVWKYLFTNNKIIEILKWFKCQQKSEGKTSQLGLASKYQNWPVDSEMIEDAIELTSHSSDALRNCFALHRTFLKDERNCTITIMHRLCTVGVLKENIDILVNRDIADICFKKNYFYFMLNFFDEPTEPNPNHKIQFIYELRKLNLNNASDWINAVELAKSCLKNKIDISSKPILALFDDLKQSTELNSEKMNEYHKKISNENCIPSIQQYLQKVHKLNLNMNLNSFDIYNNYKKYSKKYSMTFLNYIREYRSSLGVYKYLMACLEQFFVINESHLYNACKSVIRLVTAYNDDKGITVHGISFIEMLGLDSQLIRIILGLVCKLKIGHLCNDIQSILTHADEALKHIITIDKFPYDEYFGLMHLARCINLKVFPEKMLQYYALKNDWWHFLILLHFFELPYERISKFLKCFKSPKMHENLRRCLRIEVHNNNFPTMKSSGNLNKIHRKKVTKLNGTQTLFSTSENADIFNVILASSNNQKHNMQNKVGCENFLENLEINKETSKNLQNILNNAIYYNSSLLCMLSSSVEYSDIEWNWATYLAILTNQCTEFKNMCNMKKKDFFWGIVEKSLKLGYIDLLLKSVKIFFKDNGFLRLLEFLYCTQMERNFSDDVVDHLRTYLMHWSNENMCIPFWKSASQIEIMYNTVRLLLIHAEYNLNTALEVEYFLECICKSSFCEMCDIVDFCLLNKIYKIVQNPEKIGKPEIINFESIINTKQVDYEIILTTMNTHKMFDAALEIASLLNLPTSEIIYSKWVAELNEKQNTTIKIDDYEQDLVNHSLPPEMLVNFFILSATNLLDGTVRKYELMKSALEVIKKHHLFLNESFDRDQIEYDTILCYIQIESKLNNNIEIYHSEYYEEIMSKERCVLYKSFMELKELAGVEEISTAMKKPLSDAMAEQLETLMTTLLNKGDIVQALRVQELFEFRPLDLRFIVFCMALAEGVASILNLSSEDRQLFNDIEMGSFSVFNKIKLNLKQSYHQEKQSELSNSNLSFDFEEWPPKERSDTLKAIQGIVSKLNSGKEIGKRIALAYRAAMYLDKDYLDVLRTKDVGVLLKSVAEDECFHRLLVVSDITKSTKMTEQEMADLFGYEITTAIIRPRFYIFNSAQHTLNDFKSSLLWGYNIDKDLHLFLELIPNTTMLGSILLEYCDALKSYRKYQDNKPYHINSVFNNLSKIIAQYGSPSSSAQSKSSFSLNSMQVLSHKKQNLIYVELLIKAHQCFLHECSMEGIANVLNRAKTLNSVLASAKSWSLIVQMLVGIGRYREMFYCFDTLVENEQFESLLGQFDNDKAVALRQGVLAYLREHKPQNLKELFKLAALHFLMYKDLAEMMIEDAKLIQEKLLKLHQILVDEEKLNYNSKNSGFRAKLSCSEEVLQLLDQILDCYSQATENYLLDNKLLLAQKAVSAAELVAMQIDLVKKGLEKPNANRRCNCVLDIQSKAQYTSLVNTDLSIPQIIVLSRFYNYDVNWSEVLFSQYIVKGKSNVINEYLEHLDINDSIICNIVKSYQQYILHNQCSATMEQNLSYLVGLTKSSTTKYKLASILNMKATLLALINEQSMYYLKDVQFGRED